MYIVLDAELVHLLARADRLRLAGMLKTQKEEHEQYKKDNINTEKVEQQKREANDRYPQ